MKKIEFYADLKNVNIPSEKMLPRKLKWKNEINGLIFAFETGFLILTQRTNAKRCSDWAENVGVTFFIYF